MAATEDAASEHIDWDTRRLHKYSLEQIQSAFGKALQELTGKPYKIEVRSMNRHPQNELSSGLFDVVEMVVRVKEDTGPSPFSRR